MKPNNIYIYIYPIIGVEIDNFIIIYYIHLIYIYIYKVNKNI